MDDGPKNRPKPTRPRLVDRSYADTEESETRGKGWPFTGIRRLAEFLFLGGVAARGFLSQGGPSADRARRHYSHLIALLRITRLLGASAHLQEILDGISRTVLEIFEAEQTSILLLDERTQDLELRSAAGLLEEDLLGVRQHLGQGIAGWVAASGEPLLMGGVADEKRFSDLKKKPYSISDSMVVPIRLREELIGVLCVGRRTPGRTYDAEDLHMLQIFAEVVAICIRRTQQAMWMQETIRRLEGLVSANRPAA